MKYIFYLKNWANFFFSERNAIYSVFFIKKTLKPLLICRKFSAVLNKYLKYLKAAPLNSDRILTEAVFVWILLIHWNNKKKRSSEICDFSFKKKNLR